MHPSKIVFVINDDVKAIRAVYDPGAPNSSCTVFKTLAEDVKVGDIMVVESGAKHGLSICKVEEIDVEPDLESGEAILWAYSVVDTNRIKHMKDAEADAIKTVSAAERARKKAELRATMLAGSDDKVKALELSNYSAKVIDTD